MSTFITKIDHLISPLPKIVRAHQSTEIALSPRFGYKPFLENQVYQITIYPMEGKGVSGEPQRLQVLPVGGELRLPVSFAGEQEYRLWVEKVGNEKRSKALEFRVYALEDDLFKLRPFKGDLHMHSSYSDGFEPPAYMAAACRRIGLDFMAITDHRLYAPSMEAIRAFEGVGIDLRIYPGEEIHPPENPIHMINFGGRFSINDLFAQDTYPVEVQEIADRLPGEFLDATSRSIYASCLWCYQKIRQAGGLAIFSHPYWVFNHTYNVPEVLIARYYADQPFDALELVGGFSRKDYESNFLQLARYHEERTQGKRIPIVAVSDTHGCERGELFGWYYTVVFAESPGLEDLIRGIKGCSAVAVEALPGEMSRAHGPFRLVKFTQFLLREVFPQHDGLCQEEGELMLAYLTGDSTAADRLKACQGRTEALYRHLLKLPDDV